MDHQNEIHLLNNIITIRIFFERFDSSQKYIFSILILNYVLVN